MIWSQKRPWTEFQIFKLIEIVHLMSIRQLCRLHIFWHMYCIFDIETHNRSRSKHPNFHSNSPCWHIFSESSISKTKTLNFFLCVYVCIWDTSALYISCNFFSIRLIARNNEIAVLCVWILKNKVKGLLHFCLMFI